MQLNNMIKNEKGEFGLVAVLALLFDTVILVSAQVLNSTINSSFNLTLNDTLLNISPTNESVINNSLIENATSVNGTINLTPPIENATINEPINLTLPIENITFSNATVDLIINATLINQTNITLTNQTINLSEVLINTTLPNATNNSITLENRSSNYSKKLVLAKIFNEDSLDFDRNYRLKYLEDNKNFSNTNFKKIVGKEDIIFTVGVNNDNIKGFEINNQSYAVHLLYCISHKRYCVFRINGVPTKRLFDFEEFGNAKKRSFDLDGNHIIRINSVKFDYCDDRAFCHLGLEGYNIVNISIEGKK